MEKSEILTVEKKRVRGEIRARKFQFLVASPPLDLTFIGTSWNLCVFQCGQVALYCFALRWLQMRRVSAPFSRKFWKNFMRRHLAVEIKRRSRTTRN